MGYFTPSPYPSGVASGFEFAKGTPSSPMEAVGFAPGIEFCKKAWIILLYK